jgi:hypothetical protein
MKNLKELDQQLAQLYISQKEQQLLLTQRVEALQQLFSPIQAISETVKQVFAAPNEPYQPSTQSYSHLWDALTDQVGIKSPVVKSILHLLMDQMLSNFNQRAASNLPEKETKTEAIAVYHSANHF